MTPRWMEWLVRRLAPADRAEDLLGDLEEVGHRHQARRGWVLGTLLTAVETLELALTLLLHRRRRVVRLESNTSTSAGLQWNPCFRTSVSGSSCSRVSARSA